MTIPLRENTTNMNASRLVFAPRRCLKTKYRFPIQVTTVAAVTDSVLAVKGEP